MPDDVHHEMRPIFSEQPRILTGSGNVTFPLVQQNTLMTTSIAESEFTEYQQGVTGLHGTPLQMTRPGNTHNASHVHIQPTCTLGRQEMDISSPRCLPSRFPAATNQPTPTESQDTGFRSLLDEGKTLL